MTAIAVNSFISHQEDPSDDAHNISSISVVFVPVQVNRVVTTNSGI